MIKKSCKLFNLLQLIIFFSTISISKISFANANKVILDISLDDIPEATHYEIEVKNKSQVSFLKKQESPEFNLELSVGHYQVRSRAWINENVSEWSEWLELLAPPETVQFSSKNKTDYLVNKKQPTAQIQTHWNPSPGAISYLVQIEDLNNDKKIIFTSKVTDTHFSYSLPLGSYRIGVRSLSKEGLKSEISYVQNNYQVSQQVLPKIKWLKKDDNYFSWEKENESLVKIEVYRKDFFGLEFEKIDTVKTTNLFWSLKNSKLEPGEYKLQFQLISETYESGPEETFLTIKKPEEIHFKQQL